MRYVLELDSPALEVLLEAARSYKVQTATRRVESQLENGRGAQMTLALGRSLELIGKAEAALVRARATATPERANQSVSPPHNLQTGDELTFIPGRPRGSNPKPRWKR